MQIVIDIPEDAYKLLNNEGVDWLGAEHILNAVANGMPIDLDGLKSDMKALNCDSSDGLDYYYLLDCLDKRLGITIIEADKEK